MSIAVSSSIVATPERVAQPPVHRNELMSVQALRGIAVLIVLAVHVEDMANRLPAFAHLHSWYAAHFGYSGPDLFFVISGFIMSYITMGQPFRPRNWLASRFIRIYPMYFIFTALAFTIYLVRLD
ncbi:MAG: acyltransferase family protein, partial [Rhodospirillales bacterium]|nr:acyltransferase family protein [Rhodospirillales bacterium]